MHLSRRGLLAGAAATLALPASAQQHDELERFEAFRAWSAPQKGAKAPLDAMLETGEGEISLGAWMDGRPTVIALWATWCTPCLVEKAGEAAMALRLKQANARARILLVQAYDKTPLDEARAMLKRLRAEGIDDVRATKGAGKAFAMLFGETSGGSGQPAMPSLMIAAADGTELARHAGILRPVDKRKDYWYDDATFTFLSSL